MGGKLLIVAKKITKTAEEITLNTTKGDIVFNSAKSIHYSAQGNLSYGEYEPLEPRPQKSLEFKIKIKPVGGQTFVPFGIPSFQGKEENQHISFEVEVLKKGVDSIKKEILHNGKVIRSHTFDGPFPVGKHSFGWYGFDDNGVYDSTIFTTGKLQAKVTGTLNGKIGEHKSEEFSFGYKEVQWVDVKIDKNTKRIDVTLRVNLKDGGARGTECTEQLVAPDPIIIKKCPWDKISDEALTYYKKAPIKERTKSFEELKKLALEGVTKYWSRHQGNIGKGVMVNGDLYEVFVNAVNETNPEISLDDIPLIYNTNNPWSRSGNTGGSYDDGNLDDEFMKLLPDGLVQRISFNVGYIQRDYWKDYAENHWFYKIRGWSFVEENKEEEEFKFTSAHEIGHEILQAYGGTIYSWQHKGSSYYVPQDTKPVGKESFKEKYINIDYMEESKGENTPVSGKEIDLMKYYNDYSGYKNRIVADEKDVKGILWLTKIKIR